MVILSGEVIRFAEIPFGLTCTDVDKRVVILGDAVTPFPDVTRVVLVNCKSFVGVVSGVESDSLSKGRDDRIPLPPGDVTM